VAGGSSDFAVCQPRFEANDLLGDVKDDDRGHIVSNAFRARYATGSRDHVVGFLIVHEATSTA
jgi:hypothetical protein